MPNLLFAALALAQAQTTGATELKVPYKPDDATVYKVAITVTDPSGGADTQVDMTAHYKVAKKTDKGFEGSFAWTNLTVGGEGEQPDETFNVVLKPNGMLKSVDSTYGPGMRRMLIPFYFVYPDKAIEKGATWKYEDEKADETDGHTESIEYKLVGTEKVKDKDATRVDFKITEKGPEPMKGDGAFWVGADGRVLKFEINITGWPVPVASQVFDAKVKGEISG